MKKRLIKKDIVDKVSDDTGYSRYMVEEIINTVLNNIILVISQGKEVKFARFGTFTIKRRAARTGRNPKTKEAVSIPSKSVVYFKPGKALKDAVENEEGYHGHIGN